MKFFITTLTALLTTAMVVAQNTLTGTILTEVDEPLPATVYIPQLEIGTIATIDGTYILNAIPDGTYTVIFSYLGYATISSKLSFSEGVSVEKNIVMIESAVEMEDVIIAAPFHKLQSENVMKIERLAADRLERTGATTLAEGIATIPGVASISTGLGIGKPVIRGLSSNRVLTYAQGVRLENQQFGDEHGLGINGEGIESIEVIKGPASLLYGSDALGGVLYINPERFSTNGVTNADLKAVYFSNTLGYLISGGAKTSGDRLKFLARVSNASHSDYTTGEEIRVTNTRFNETDLKTGIRFQGSTIKSTLRYNYNRANIGIPESFDTQSTSKELMDPYQEIDNHIISLENNFFFEDSSLDFKVGYIFNDRREFEEDSELAALRLKLSTLNYDLKYNLPDFGKFETIVGVQGLFQQNKNFGEEILIPDANMTDFGILGTTHYHLEKVDIQAGLRFDHRKLEGKTTGSVAEDNLIPAIDRDFNSFNAAFGIKTDITDALLARFNVASGFRAPNLAELTSNGVHEGTNRYEIGNTDLNNEQNLQFDLSVEYGNEHLELNANIFHNTVNDYIFIQPNGEMIDDNPVYIYTQDDSQLYGGEFGFHLHPHPLDWLHFESNFQTVSGRIKGGDDLPLIPANSLSNTLHIEFGTLKKFDKLSSFIALRSVFDQEKFSEFETRTGGYSLMDLGGSGIYKVNKLNIEFAIVISNIFNKNYTAHLSRLKVDEVANIGRNLRLSITASI